MGIARRLPSGALWKILNFTLRDPGSGNTPRLTMKSLTVKIPEAIDATLRRKAKANKVPVSVIVRRALVREMEADAADFAKSDNKKYTSVQV